MKFLLFVSLAVGIFCTINAEEEKTSSSLLDKIAADSEGVIQLRAKKSPQSDQFQLQAPNPMGRAYGSPAPAPSSYGSPPSYSAPAPSYAPPPPPSYPGPAKPYSYQATFAPQQCGQNLLFSCQPAVAPVPCQAPPPQKSYAPAPAPYSAPAPAPSY